MAQTGLSASVKRPAHGTENGAPVDMLTTMVHQHPLVRLARIPVIVSVEIVDITADDASNSAEVAGAVP